MKIKVHTHPVLVAKTPETHPNVLQETCGVDGEDGVDDHAGAEVHPQQPEVPDGSCGTLGYVFGAFRPQSG